MEHLIGQRLTELRVKKSLTQDEMAEKLGIKRARYNSWENDISRPDLDMLMKLADFHKMTIDELVGRNSYYSSKEPTIMMVAEDTDNYLDSTSLSDINNHIPLVGTICAGDGLLAEENIEDYVRYPFIKKTQPDFALRVKGNSMLNAGIKDGDIVFMRKKPWAEYSGQIVAAVINGEEGTLKRMKWSLDSPFIHLIPENDEYDSKTVYPNELLVCGVYAGHFTPEKER